jgi:predicted small lipoprotein YifL
MKIAQRAMLICLAGTMLACGQKGPLVLPDEAAKHKRTIPAPPAAKPAPAGEGTTTSPAPAPATPAPAPPQQP